MTFALHVAVALFKNNPKEETSFSDAIFFSGGTRPLGKQQKYE
jgi:hypothetical protein